MFIPLDEKLSKVEDALENQNMFMKQMMLMFTVGNGSSPKIPTPSTNSIYITASPVTIPQKPNAGEQDCIWTHHTPLRSSHNQLLVLSLPKSPIAAVQLSPKTPSRHKCLPIQFKSDNLLPSQGIKSWEGKIDIQQVISVNHSLCNTGKLTTLAVRIAREAVYGDCILRQCTPLGTRGLSKRELEEDKKGTVRPLSCLCQKPEEFEPIWAARVSAIGQCCKKLRKKMNTY